jgi:hypothetical protein
MLMVAIRDYVRKKKPFLANEMRGKLGRIVVESIPSDSDMILFETTE